MKLQWLMLYGITLAAALTVSACTSGGGDDNDPTGLGPGDPVDTVAPEVILASPSNGQMETDTQSQILVTFNETMDQADPTGQVSMTHGNIVTAQWAGGSTLLIDHDGWPEATQVSVILATGLADEAGNSLAAPLTLTFWTLSSELLVLEQMPAAGATNVNRAAFFDLLFSAPMNQASFATGITIDDDTKVLNPFSVEELDNFRYRLRPDEPLATNSLITVTIGTGVMSDYGSGFAAPYEFSFTTGELLDDTPPTIVAFDPPNGSTMPTDQGFITVEFSESLDTVDFAPSSLNGQLAWLLGLSTGQLEWNMDQTLLTVPLPADLPAGLPLRAAFAGYVDINGNVQTDETVWTCTVAGTPDPYPVWDGRRYLAVGDWEEGVAGSSTPTDFGEEWVWYQFNARSTAGQWEKAEYRDEWVTLDYYEIQTVNAAGVNIVGFAEDDEGNGVFQEFFASRPVTQVELPLVDGNTWSTTASVPTPDGTLGVTMAGEVMGQEDLPYEFDGIEIVWTDVWRVVLTVDLRFGGSSISDEETTFWVAPGVGVVREIYHEDNLEEENWSEYDRWLQIDLDQGGK